MYSVETKVHRLSGSRLYSSNDALVLLVILSIKYHIEIRFVFKYTFQQKNYFQLKLKYSNHVGLEILSTHSNLFFF